MTRLIIWRHGQTEWNASDRIQGHSDVGLDDLGRAQAVAAAEVLAAESPDLLVTSDLRRAADTAAALAAVTGLVPHPDPRLRERYFGTWQGLTGGQAQAAYPEAYARWRGGEPVGTCAVEELDDLAKRVAAAVSDAVDQARGGTVVIATHGGSAKYALGEMLGWSRDVTGRIVVLANCHWSELRHDAARGWLLRAHNVGVPRRGEGSGVTASPQPPSWVPGNLRLPSAGKPAGALPERIITGVVEAGVESRCLVMTASDGVQYLLLNGDPQVVRVGARLTIVGRPAPGVMTTCMQGLPFMVIRADPAG